MGCAAVSDGTGAVRVFSGIGTLRIHNPNKSQGSDKPDPAVLIITISFPYKADDRPFTEELASNLGKFRSVATNYFANLPRDNLVNLDEEQAKAEILRQYNALLRLGRIETLYFGDLMVVE
jgi:flagellar basal body-associated protein FliL